MLIANFPPNETERLTALQECQILDTKPESEYNSLAELAAQICDAPIGIISLVDAERQWLKAKVGITMEQSSRDDSFCAHALLNPDRLMIVPDALLDERFYDNPLVIGSPHIRFYAGAPILLNQESGGENTDGKNAPLVLGMVSVLDSQPRNLTEAQCNALKILAAQVGKLLSLRRQHLLSQRYVEQLRQATEKMNEAERLASLGSWSYDIATDTTVWTAETFRLMDIDPADTVPDFEMMLSRYYPEDRGVLRQAILDAIDQGRPHDLELRLRLRNGQTRWVRVQGRAVRDESGKIVGLVGSGQDVTLNKESEFRISPSRTIYSALSGNYASFPTPPPMTSKSRSVKRSCSFPGWRRRFAPRASPCRTKRRPPLNASRR